MTPEAGPVEELEQWAERCKARAIDSYGEGWNAAMEYAIKRAPEIFRKSREQAIRTDLAHQTALRETVRALEERGAMAPEALARVRDHIERLHGLVETACLFWKGTIPAPREGEGVKVQQDRLMAHDLVQTADTAKRRALEALIALTPPSPPAPASEEMPPEERLRMHEERWELAQQAMTMDRDTIHRLEGEVREQAATHADCCVDRQDLAMWKQRAEAAEAEVARLKELADYPLTPTGSKLLEAAEGTIRRLEGEVARLKESLVKAAYHEERMALKQRAEAAEGREQWLIKDRGRLKAAMRAAIQVRRYVHENQDDAVDILEHALNDAGPASPDVAGDT